MNVENIRGISFVSSRGNAITYLLKTLQGDYLTRALGSPLRFDAKGALVYMGEPQRAYRLPTTPLGAQHDH